ncbi:unnamed protein product [Symbiodinium natans]|uniref:Uncharacterized protein n=1 Tax=Symbiodinium natans TaxID=878477 RepID=A0A812H8Z3_9DINO|nr:unnamed protein product [Symbiodinium natans]
MMSNSGRGQGQAPTFLQARKDPNGRLRPRIRPERHKETQAASMRTSICLALPTKSALVALVADGAETAVPARFPASSEGKHMIFNTPAGKVECTEHEVVRCDAVELDQPTRQQERHSTNPEADGSSWSTTSGPFGHGHTRLTECFQGDQ